MALATALVSFDAAAAQSAEAESRNAEAADEAVNRTGHGSLPFGARNGAGAAGAFCQLPPPIRPCRSLRRPPHPLRHLGVDGLAAERPAGDDLLRFLGRQGLRLLTSNDGERGQKHRGDFHHRRHSLMLRA